VIIEHVGTWSSKWQQAAPQTCTVQVPILLPFQGKAVSTPLKISSTEKKLGLFMDRACVCQRKDDSIIVIGKAVVCTLFNKINITDAWYVVRTLSGHLLLYLYVLLESFRTAPVARR
jgi:hypothetical protein